MSEHESQVPIEDRGVYGDFFNWEVLADRVEARSFPGIAQTMRETSGPERSNIAQDAADCLAGRPGAQELEADLRSAAYSIRMGF